VSDAQNLNQVQLVYDMMALVSMQERFLLVLHNIDILLFFFPFFFVLSQDFTAGSTNSIHTIAIVSAEGFMCIHKNFKTQ
jgi:hypothetical protein